MCVCVCLCVCVCVRACVRACVLCYAEVVASFEGTFSLDQIERITILTWRPVTAWTEGGQHRGVSTGGISTAQVMVVDITDK